MLTPRAVTALVDLAHTLRPEWDSPGIRAAIRSCEHRDPYTVAQALIRRAGNPANQTPQLQPHDFDDTPAARCPARSGSWPHGRCAGCIDAAERERAEHPLVVVRSCDHTAHQTAVDDAHPRGQWQGRVGWLPSGWEPCRPLGPCDDSGACEAATQTPQREEVR